MWRDYSYLGRGLLCCDISSSETGTKSRILESWHRIFLKIFKKESYLREVLIARKPLEQVKNLYASQVAVYAELISARVYMHSWIEIFTVIKHIAWKGLLWKNSLCVSVLPKNKYIYVRMFVCAWATPIFLLPYA